MKKLPVILLLAFFAMPSIYGQIKIGDNPQAISPTSVLELESNDRVLVITRINTQQMDAIVPNQGAMIYNTDTQCIHYYDGAAWINLCAAAFEIPDNSINTQHIVNGGVNGIDIQDGSIGPGKLQNQSVTQDKLSENSVGAFALDNDNINLSDFTNDLDLLTISTVAGNAITNNAGAYYNDENLQTNIAANTAAIDGHIAADGDTNANNEIQSLTLTGNQLEISGSNTITLPSTTGEIDDNELITNAVLTGTDLVITEAGTNFTVPLGSLAGGGSQNLTSVLTQGNDAGAALIRNVADPTLPQDAATRAYVDANIGGNQNLAQVLAQGTDGGAALIKNILDPVDPQDAATRAYVDANGGNQNLAQVLAQGTDGGAALIKNILDPVDPQDAATRAYVLATVASGGSLTDGSILIGGAGDVAQQLAINGDATMDNLGELIIADDAVELSMLAPPDPAGTPAPANGQVMVWDNDTGEWVIDAQAGQHTGTPKSLFFAGNDGLPREFLHPGNGNPSLIWDYEARVVSGTAYGALGIGLDGNPINDNVKTHIIDIVTGNVSYPLLVHNRTATAGSGVGILFSSDSFNDGKGALILERQGGYGVGDFHFLHNTNNGAREAPTLANDKAFTIKNNKDIQLYGGIDVDGTGTTTGLGTAGQVLTSTGVGGVVEWTAKGGAASTVDADANDGLTHVLTAAGYDVNVDDSTIEKFGDDLRVKENGITSNEINDGAVGPDQLEEFSVTTAKIDNGTILAEDLNDMGAANNEVLKWNGTAWAPAADAGGVAYTAGAGLTLSGANEFAVDGSTIVADWSNLTNIPADIDDGDDDTTYTAGVGLTLSGANEFAVDGSTIVADWTNLTNIPADIDDGDDDTTYTAGTGLTLSGADEFSVDNLAGDVTGPTSATVIANGVISDANIVTGANIAGSKINPDFGGLDITTTGNVTAFSFISNTMTYPDYVFEKYFLGISIIDPDYKFTNLNEIDQFLRANHHLPGIKSAKEIEEADGNWNLTEGALKNLEKIEELFLHTIEQENKIKSLQSENENLADELNTIKKDLEEIKSMLKKSN